MFCISRVLAYRITKQYERSPEKLAHQQLREQTRREKEDAISNTVQGLLESHSHIYNATAVAQ